MDVYFSPLACSLASRITLYETGEEANFQRVDTRADVYSAGILLFELLAGRRPFEGGPLAVARAHADGAVPDLRTLDPGLPAGVARLVARATAREPERRPPDAGSFLDELRSVRAGLRPAELDLRFRDQVIARLQ